MTLSAMVCSTPLFIRSSGIVGVLGVLPSIFSLDIDVFNLLYDIDYCEVFVERLNIPVVFLKVQSSILNLYAFLSNLANTS